MYTEGMRKTERAQQRKRDRSQRLQNTLICHDWLESTSNLVAVHTKKARYFKAPLPLVYTEEPLNEDPTESL